jgi:hypothetical protein
VIRIAPRWQWLLVPAVLGLLLLVVMFASSGAVGVALVLLLVFALALTVGVHWLLSRSSEEALPRCRGLLRTPGQVALAVVVVFGGGATVAVVASMLVGVAAPSVVGDGGVLVRVMLVVFALGPCLSLGQRCGRWWAFTGAAAVVPLLGFCVLVGGPRSWSGFGVVSVAVVAAAFAVAAGSLQQHLAAVTARQRTSHPAAAGEEEEPELRYAASAGR